MVAVRRLYFLIVSAVSLAMLVAGAAATGSTIIEWITSAGAITPSFRQSIAGATALALVGLPIWALHWSFAQRLARGDPSEHASALRRLYVYVVLGSLLVAVSVFGGYVLDLALLRLIDSGRDDATSLLRTLWEFTLLLAFWVYHFRIAEADRAAVGESGASATLRRWYAYAAVVIALVVLLFAGRELLITILFNLMDEQPRDRAHMAETIATTLTALAVWLFHSRWTSEGALHESDRGSTLRTVAGFTILALSVAMVLTQTSRALYYALARVLGVERPGGQSGDLAGLLVTPLATVVIFGISWAFARRSLAQDAAESEAPRQAGVRRLYTHLIVFLALLTFTGSIAALLWTIVDMVTVQPPPVDPTAYRDRISLSLTLIAVGLPMWIAHWRPAPPDPERWCFSRRLYLFAALLVAVLAVLGSGAYLLERVLATVLGVGSVSPWSDLGRAASLTVVATAVGIYHWRILRLDNSSRQREQMTASEHEQGLQAPPSLVVEITGASESDVRSALAGLPESARYTVRSG